MNKILTFKVEIEGLENKIWRKIEIIDRMTVADLAYTILATFNSLAYHLFDIKYKDKVYDCWIEIEYDHRIVPPINATITTLCKLKLKNNDNLKMRYDYGSTTNFNITYLGSREATDYEGYLYPNIVDGAGQGMLDDLCDFELKKIVDDTDEKGYSEYYFTPGYEKHKKYDYRKFNIKTNNRILKGKVLEFKNKYEVYD